jgi:hypothetical protein
MQVERYPDLSGESGARVRNAYAICLMQGDSPGKPGLIPHRSVVPHGTIGKDLSA